MPSLNYVCFKHNKSSCLWGLKINWMDFSRGTRFLILNPPLPFVFRTSYCKWTWGSNPDSICFWKNLYMEIKISQLNGIKNYPRNWFGLGVGRLKEKRFICGMILILVQKPNANLVRWNWIMKKFPMSITVWPSWLRRIPSTSILMGVSKFLLMISCFLVLKVSMSRLLAV